MSTTFTFAPAAGVTHSIRAVTLEDVPWFVAADVCRALGLKTGPDGSFARHFRRLAPQERRVTNKSDLGVSGKGGALTLISEGGLYKLILRSDKPVARAFQEWVTRAVLPSIRQHGGYVRGQEHLPPDEKADLLSRLEAMAASTMEAVRMAREAVKAAQN